MADYTEPCCCFDASLYTGTPDTSPVEYPLDVHHHTQPDEHHQEHDRALQAERLPDHLPDLPGKGGCAFPRTATRSRQAATMLS